MRLSYTIIAVCLIRLLDHTLLYSQTSDLIFPQCADTVTRLCVQDMGIRLPASNQVYLGVGHPDATRGSVHVSRSRIVSGGCGSVLNYKIELRSEDSATIIPIKLWTDVTLDTTGVATLSFDTEFSPDSVIRHAGIAYNSKCDSNYTIIWTVSDSCGMEVSCVEELHLYDCQTPVATPATQFYVEEIPIGCILLLEALDYNTDASDDRSDGEELLFSLSADMYLPELTLDPCSIPAYGVELPYSIWIADEGFDNNCDGQTDWAERNKVKHDFEIVFVDFGQGCCEPIDQFGVDGRVTLADDFGLVNNVTVLLEGENEAFTAITNLDGLYQFLHLPPGNTLRLTPSKNINHKNGVSTLDLIRMQKHLLGVEPFTSPQQFIAADANNSSSLSVIDLIELRKLILGIYTELPNNTSWKFVAKEPGFVDSLGSIYFESSIVFSPSENVNGDFYGIKIGDLNNTVNPANGTSLQNRTLNKKYWSTFNQQLCKGETVMVPFQLEESEEITGFQFTLAFPGFEFIGMRPGSIAVSEDDYALFYDRLTMSWFDINGTDIAPEDTLFFLELKALQTIDISQSLKITSSLTEAEMYLENEETFQPILRFAGNTEESKEFQVSCSPNPWNDQTEILISLSSEEKINITVFTSEAQQVWSYSETLPAGVHRIPLSKSELGAKGPMVLEASTAHGTIVQKMIVLD